jgi:hypothetical protein
MVSPVVWLRPWQREAEKLIRKCVGTDLTLTGRDGTGNCNCGLIFDDVERMVIWPHNPVGPKLTLTELDKLWSTIRTDRTDRE